MASELQSGIGVATSERRLTASEYDIHECDHGTVHTGGCGIESDHCGGQWTDPDGETQERTVVKKRTSGFP